MRRTSVLRFILEMFRVIIFEYPRRYKGVRISYFGMIILFIAVAVFTNQYNTLGGILAVVGAFFILFGLVYWGAEATFEEEEEEPETLMFKSVMEELKDIKNRLERLEKYHVQDETKKVV